MPPSNEHETEVALALCNLACDGRSPHSEVGVSSPPPADPLSRLADAACSSAPCPPSGSNVVSPSTSDPSYARAPPLPPHFPAQLQTCPFPKPALPQPMTSAYTVPVRKASHLDISARRAKKNDIKRRITRVRGGDTSVTFEEMTRLMNTYGPLKCLRNRKSKNPDKEIKTASILRKFYRWFPDFEGVLMLLLSVMLFIVHRSDSSYISP